MISAFQGLYAEQKIAYLTLGGVQKRRTAVNLILISLRVKRETMLVGLKFFVWVKGHAAHSLDTAVHLLNIVEHAVRMVIALPILNDEISYCLNQLLCENLRTRFSFFSAKEFF